MTMLDERQLLAYLETNSLAYERWEHPPVFTCAESEMHRPNRSAVSTKNLFLCDKNARRFILLVTDCEKKMDLALIGEQTGLARTRFASPENMLRLLGVTPGSVTMMGLVNDTSSQVELWIDDEIWGQELFQSHPLVNTATLLLSKETLLRFFELTGHEVKLIRV
ncbi:MAG: prolyl-tRNA synthetase associated domain-containing protein [Chloroflexota bacterium]